MIDRRSLVVAGLCFGAQLIPHRTEAASTRTKSDTYDCHDIADEIEIEASGRIFDPSTNRLSWAPRLSDK